MYIFVKLFKQDEEKDKIIWKWNIQKNINQIMVEKLYLWIILCLKSTFDILLSHKINFQSNWIRIYNKCLQGIIHAKYHMMVTRLCT
jgi:hypothetical protein